MSLEAEERDWVPLPQVTLAGAGLSPLVTIASSLTEEVKSKSVEWFTAWLPSCNWREPLLSRSMNFWEGTSFTWGRERKGKEVDMNNKEHWRNSLPAVCFEILALLEDPLTAQWCLHKPQLLSPHLSSLCHQIFLCHVFCLFVCLFVVPFLRSAAPEPTQVKRNQSLSYSATCWIAIIKVNN